MNPVAFRILGIDVMWYGIIIASAMVAAVFLAGKNGKKVGIREDDVLDLSLWALPLAVVGARLYYVAFNFRLYQEDLLSIFNTRLGGMALHGGLIGGFLGGLLVAKRKGLNILKTADIIAPAVSLGQAIGRWGNFVNQEAHGGPTDLPWGILIDGVKVHPTFLYESIWNLGVMSLLLFFLPKKKYDGQIVSFYLIAYSLGRFWIEGLRTDSLMLGSLRAAQLVSLLMIGAGVLLHFLLKNRGIRPPYIKESNDGI
ncbi:MAG: prolipoprotein diacylglyceryl transferase [Peptostreptococcaceae bacterium]|nr:prolipoprotein diacylglyceryl transferase [Peptostreptococcaceae bacterium]